MDFPASSQEARPQWVGWKDAVYRSIESALLLKCIDNLKRFGKCLAILQTESYPSK